MNRLTFEDVQLADLDNCAARLMDFAADARVFLFFGEMGAGKTTFIHALCKYLGVKGETGSPTFALVNEYEGSTSLIYHFDMYRIEDEREALDIGMEEYLDSGNYCLIEWPERITGLLPLHYIQLKIAENNGIRSITAEKV